MDVFHSQFRFIPVGTGNTFHKTTCILQATVHPRGHGEHITSLALNEPSAGSSPWARGTLTSLFVGLFFLRFIPVGTGNTNQYSIAVRIYTVHPRGHGEHTHGVHFVKITRGSSPWARGTQHQWRGSSQPSRFIPVGTGNTISTLDASFFFTVHPRGHGEHALYTKYAIDKYGSSPWARGTLYG